MDINNGELVFEDADQVKSAIEISILSWARSDNSYGWFFRDMGSLLWQSYRSKLNEDEVRMIESDCRKSLLWMIRDGLCKTISVNSTSSHDTLNLFIRVDDVQYQFNNTYFPQE